MTTKEISIIKNLIANGCFRYGEQTYTSTRALSRYYRTAPKVIADLLDSWRVKSILVDGEKAYQVRLPRR